MVIITRNTINAFINEHPEAAEPLNRWYNIAISADWGSFADIKQAFNSVDAVGNDRFVFNIKGNSFRLVAMIFFNKRTLYIRFIGTHLQYDKIDCSII